MRPSAQAILPIFLACFAFILIATLWDTTDSREFANAAARRSARANAGKWEDPAQRGSGREDRATLMRGRLVDAQSGEPVTAQVSLLGPRGLDLHGEAGADGNFQVDCPTSGRWTLAIPRGERHFGLVREVDSRNWPAGSTLKLEPRRDLPVLLRTPDGRPLSQVVPPQGPWARETWPSILVTQAPPTGRPAEGGPDPLLATRVGRFVSTVYGEVPLRPGSPECCVGYLRLFQAPPASCSLVIGSRVLRTVVLDGREKLLSFIVDPAELRDTHASLELRVVDADTGLPPAPRRGLWLGMLGGAATELSAELDADGHVVIEDVPAGSVELQLRLSGYEHESRRFDLRAGERNDLGELRVRIGACLAGHVVSESGDPIRARIWSCTREGREHPAGQVTPTPADADWFAVCGLPRSTVLVGIDDPLWALNPIEVDLGEGSVQNERLVARQGSLLRLIGPYSASGTARLRVLDARRLCIWKGDNVEQEVNELRLLPGRYVVEVQREGSPATRQEVDLEQTSDATIVLR